MTLAIFLLMLSIAVNPSPPINGARGAVNLCISSVIPSLLPCLVLNNILIMSGAFDKSFGPIGRLFSKVFKLPPSSVSAVASGLLSGYPTGAKTAGELYDRGGISHAGYKTLISFCNCAGGAFVTGTAGSAIFGSAKIGKLLFLAHMISALCVGLIFRFIHKNKAPCRHICSKRPYAPFYETFTKAVECSVETMGKICGYIIFFGMLMAKAEPFISRLPGCASGLLYGFFEMTGGIARIASSSCSLSFKTAAASAILGWGGWCVHMQSMPYIKDKKTYLTGKALQGMISFIITYIFAKSLLGESLCPSFTTPSRLSLALIVSVLVFYIIFAAVPRRASRLRRQAP